MQLTSHVFMHKTTWILMCDQSESSSFTLTESCLLDARPNLWWKIACL